MEFIFLDNASTTKIHPEVAAAAGQMASVEYFNSAALYPPAVVVKRKIEAARLGILKRLGAAGGDLIFTSGATESNNLLIFGRVTNARDRIVVLDGEHSSVYAPAKYLAENGFSVGFVPLLKTGECDLDALVRAVAPTGSAIFRAGEGAGVTVVFGLVNSDVGTIQDAKTIVERIRAVSPRAHIHMDATQAFCKIPFNVSELGVDSVSISAHKIHGPKGVGALWVRKGVTLRAQMLGGGQQALRAGTENNPGVVGFGRAVELFDTEKHFAFVSELHGRLATAMEEIGARRLGGGKNPYISMWILPNRVFGQTIMNALGEVGVLVGLGSACNGTNRNRTLTAMGVSDADAKSVLRISLSSFNTAAEIDVFVEKISKILKSLS